MGEEAHRDELAGLGATEHWELGHGGTAGGRMEPQATRLQTPGVYTKAEGSEKGVR